jgi:vacuolar-type H+-ATPase subunit H
MSVEGIIDKILGDARSAARTIVQDAEKEAESIRAEARREAAEYYERQRTLLEEHYRKEKERSVLNKRLETRKNTLGVKQQWLKRAFDETYTALVDQPLSEYRDILLRLIGAASKSKGQQGLFRGDRRRTQEKTGSGRNGGEVHPLSGWREFPLGVHPEKGQGRGEHVHRQPFQVPEDRPRAEGVGAVRC